MTPDPKELRELADVVECSYSDDPELAVRLTAAIRACAEREERAQAGITESVLDDALTAYMRGEELLDPPSACLRAALKAAALVLQGDREKLRALVEKWRDMPRPLTSIEEGYITGQKECAADLSRAIGDEK